MTTTNSNYEEIDLSAFAKARDPDVRAQVAEWSEKTEEEKRRVARRRELMAPPGALGLPVLLEQRRQALAIPDDVFEFSQPIFDNVYLYAVPRHAEKTFVKGGSIIMTDQQADYEKHATPRGLLIAAGAGALDYLWSNGVDLGHIVNFAKYTQWRMEAGMVELVSEYVLPLKVGQLLGSEDLKRMLRNGEARYERDPKTNRHILVMQDGPRGFPQNPYNDMEE